MLTPYSQKQKSSHWVFNISFVLLYFIHITIFDNSSHWGPLGSIYVVSFFDILLVSMICFSRELVVCVLGGGGWESVRVRRENTPVWKKSLTESYPWNPKAISWESFAPKIYILLWCEARVLTGWDYFSQSPSFFPEHVNLRFKPLTSWWAWHWLPDLSVDICICHQDSVLSLCLQFFF